MPFTKLTIIRIGGFSLSRQHLILILVASLLTVILLLTVIILAALLSSCQLAGPSKDSETQKQPLNTFINVTTQKPADRSPKSILTGDLKIISRMEWVAKPSLGHANPLELPVPYVIIQHTGSANCSDHSSCTSEVRALQSIAQENNHWWDIGYNFLVGGDGYAYEGRGWKYEGAHSYGFDEKSLGITFIGDFNHLLPPKRQINAAKQLIQKGVEWGYIAADYKLLAHRQLQTTHSPGLLLYEDIKGWPHWAEHP